MFSIVFQLYYQTDPKSIILVRIFLALSLDGKGLGWGFRGLYAAICLMSVLESCITVALFLFQIRWHLKMIVEMTFLLTLFVVYDKLHPAFGLQEQILKL